MNDLLARVLTAPECLKSVGLRDWNYLIPEARRAGLLSRIDALLAEHELLDKVPQQPRLHLQSARVTAENEKRVMVWELNRIARALGKLDVPIVLLKGAAYVIGNLPNARGRISSDVDILVPRTMIDHVEKALLDHGWRHIKLDDYDQYFYRHWSHELPPLQHKDRGTILDVHHTILPPTGRLHPDPKRLITASLPVEGTMFRVLAPVDMVLHSAAHAFQDGDFGRGVRDLVDIDDLLRDFGTREVFWQDLVPRAAALQLTRPLYYALRYAQRYFMTPIPDSVWETVRSWRPSSIVLAIMDTLLDHALTPSGPDGKNRQTRFSLLLLYIRAHWLRMPPWLLAKHLLMQSRRRLKREKQG